MAKKTVISYLLAFSVFFSAFADFTVLSPASGVWANKQALQILLPEGEEAYYSVNGTDPLVSGFAYDSPVIIDLTGDVEIRISSIGKDGKKTEKTVSYSVVERFPAVPESESFLINFLSVPVYEYIPGKKIEVPSGLKTASGNGELVFTNAKELYLSEDCSLESYVPVVFSDGKSFWRTMIHTIPKAGTVAQSTVPFKIEDWTHLTFTDKSYIYCVDDQWWQGSANPAELDRTKYHIIRWQAVDFNQVNPINSFELPPKPELNILQKSDGAVVYSLSGDSTYKLSAENSYKNTYAKGQFKSICMDAFSGDDISGELFLNVYKDNVYQGKLRTSYKVDRRPPKVPTLVSSVSGFFIRKPLDFKIFAEAGSKIYVSESTPLPLPKDFSAPPPEAEFYGQAVLGSYREISGNSYAISADTENAMYHKISVYAQDEYGNKSEDVEYGVVIDQCNYYFDESSNSPVADGSRSNPFKSFDQIEFNKKLPRYINLHIRGTVKLPSKQIQLPVNCKISGFEDALLEFQEGTSFLVRSSSLEIENCLINKNEKSQKEAKNLFVLENSTLALSNCELIAQFENSGTIANASNSIVSIDNCGIISQALSYASVVASNKSKVHVKKSRISAIGETAVAFSVHGGEISLTSNACKVIGSIGRIAELIGLKCSFVSNSFAGEIDSIRSSQAIWKDGDVKVLADSNNTIKGF